MEAIGIERNKVMWVLARIEPNYNRLELKRDQCRSYLAKESWRETLYTIYEVRKSYRYVLIEK